MERGNVGVLLGLSTEKRPIELFQFGTRGKKILIIGGTHGHPERQSVDFCTTLIEQLLKDSGLLNCRLMLIPELNPDSTHVDGVQTTANGIDLNRNFPSANQHLTDKSGKNKGGEPLSEPESKIVFSLVRDSEPDLIIAIHQMYKCLDYDGPADQETLDELSKAFDLPIKKLGACNGSMGSYFGEELKIPLITVEFEFEMTAQRISDTAARLVSFLQK